MEDKYGAEYKTMQDEIQALRAEVAELKARHERPKAEARQRSKVRTARGLGALVATPPAYFFGHNTLTNRTDVRPVY